MCCLTWTVSVHRCGSFLSYVLRVSNDDLGFPKNRKVDVEVCSFPTGFQVKTLQQLSNKDFFPLGFFCNRSTGQLCSNSRAKRKIRTFDGLLYGSPFVAMTLTDARACVRACAWKRDIMFHVCHICHNFLYITDKVCFFILFIYFYFIVGL